ELFPLLPERVGITDALFDLSAGIVNLIGINSLFDECVLLLFGQVYPDDAIALEPRLGLIETEVRQIALLYRLMIGIERGRRLVIAVEGAERVPIQKGGGRGGQADHARIEIVHHLGKAIEEGAMGLIENDQVEKSRAELRKTAAERLQGRDIEP